MVRSPTAGGWGLGLGAGAGDWGWAAAALRQPAYEEFGRLVDEVEDWTVRRGGEYRASRQRRPGRRRVHRVGLAQQTLDSRRDFASIDQGTDRLGERRTRRRQARDLHQRRREGAARV